MNLLAFLSRFSPLQQIAGGAGLVAFLVFGGWVWSMKSTIHDLQDTHDDHLLEIAQLKAISMQIGMALDKCSLVNQEITQNVEIATQQALAAQEELARRELEIQHALQGIAEQQQALRNRLSGSACVRYDEPLDPGFIVWLRDDGQTVPDPGRSSDR